MYLSNIHYLNWSDNPNGRITGLTRYACFWVENGEIVGPINTMRFDDSFYNYFGDNLLEVGNKTEFIPILVHMGIVKLAVQLAPEY